MLEVCSAIHVLLYVRFFFCDFRFAPVLWLFFPGSFLPPVRAHTTFLPSFKMISSVLVLTYARFPGSSHFFPTHPFTQRPVGDVASLCDNPPSTMPFCADFLFTLYTAFSVILTAYSVCLYLHLQM